jgi:probable selenate reductase FAD-binding subunit
MQFHKPATLAEAAALKADLGEAAVYLAGGTEVNSADFTHQPGHVISLADLTPNAITLAPEGISIGAGCTIQGLIDAEESPAVLRSAAYHAAGRNIRNMATIGGHIAGHQPCAELAGVLIALGATVDVLDAHTETTVSIVDYLARRQRGLIGRIRIPRQLPARRVAVERYARCAGDAAVVSVAVGLTVESSGIGDAVVAVAGLSPGAIRLTATEASLRGELPAREELERRVAGELDPSDDRRGSAAFKRRLTVELVASAVNAAARAGGAQT